MQLKRKQAEEVSVLKKDLTKITLDLDKSNAELQKIRNKGKKTKVRIEEEEVSPEEGYPALREETLKQGHTPRASEEAEGEQEEEEHEKTFEELTFEEKWYETMTNILPNLPLVNSITDNVTFIEYIKENIIFANFIHTAFDIVFKYVESVVEDKMIDLLAVLGIKTGSKVHGSLKSSLDPFWKNNWKEVFRWSSHKRNLFRCYSNEFKVACVKFIILFLGEGFKNQSYFSRRPRIVRLLRKIIQPCK